jgi:hypothetical protein
MNNDSGKMWKTIAGALFAILQLIALFYLNQIDARLQSLADRENGVEQRVSKLEGTVATLPPPRFRQPRQTPDED